MILRLALLLVAFSGQAQDSLLLYYNSEIALEPHQIETLSIDNIENGDNYQKALGYYQLGRLQMNDKPIEAFHNLGKSVKMYEEGDTVDNFLYWAGLQNQGLIARRLGVYKLSYSLYEKALTPVSKLKPTRRLSLMYNIGFTLKYYDKLEAMKVFQQLIEESSKINDQKYQSKGLRQVANLYRSFEYYDTAEYYYEKAAELRISNSVKSWVYHDWADNCKLQGNHARQEKLLLKSIDLNASSQFQSSLDLAELYIADDRGKEALELLVPYVDEYKEIPETKTSIRLWAFLDELDFPLPIGMKSFSERSLAFIENQEVLLEEQDRRNFNNYLEDQERQRETNDLITMLTLLGASAVLFALIVVSFLKYQAYRKKRIIEEEIRKMKSFKL